MALRPLGKRVHALGEGEALLGPDVLRKAEVNPNDIVSKHGMRPILTRYIGQTCNRCALARSAWRPFSR
jgi:hypothetical protein